MANCIVNTAQFPYVARRFRIFRQWRGALQDYCRSHYINSIEDLNGDFCEGFGILPISQLANKRASAVICYLGSDVRACPNLQIVTDAMVRSLNTEGSDGQRCVTGVSAVIDGETRSFISRQVIASTGALQSPVMLLRAGVGPAEALERAGSRSLPTGPALVAIYAIIICCNWSFIYTVMRALPMVCTVIQPQRSAIPPMFRVARL